MHLCLFSFKMLPVSAITDIPVLPRNFRTSSLFAAICKTSPSARRVAAVNRLWKDVDIFRKPTASLEQVLR